MTKPRLLTFKRLRIAILLGVLAVVAGSTYYQVHAMANWSRPLIMTIYPINGTGTAAVAKYINNLKMDDFADLARFLDEEAAAWENRIKMKSS